MNKRSRETYRWNIIRGSKSEALKNVRMNTKKFEMLVSFKRRQRTNRRYLTIRFSSTSFKNIVHYFTVVYIFILQ